MEDRQTKPNVPVWREAQSSDDVIVVQSVEVLAIVQVPQHGFAVFSAAGTQTTVRRDGNGIEVTCVSKVVDLKTAVGQVPYLDGAVPTGRYDDWIGVVRGETNTGYLENSQIVIFCGLCSFKYVGCQTTAWP